MRADFCLWKSERESWLQLSWLALWPWIVHLTFWFLSFISYKMKETSLVVQWLIRLLTGDWTPVLSNAGDMGSIPSKGIKVSTWCAAQPKKKKNGKIHPNKSIILKKKSEWWMDKQISANYTVEYYSVIKRSELSSYKKTWLNLKFILLNERSQFEKKNYILSDFNYTTFWKRQNSKDNKWKDLEGWRKGAWGFSGSETVLIIMVVVSL